MGTGLLGVSQSDSKICGQDLWSDGTGTLGNPGLIMDRTRVHLVFAEKHKTAMYGF
jgi:hypothetical protein